MFFSVFCRDSQVLTSAQNEFVKETETKVYRLLEETPPNGKSFAQTVRHMLKREELWNNWKNEGCKGKYSGNLSTDKKKTKFTNIFLIDYRVQASRATNR